MAAQIREVESFARVWARATVRVLWDYGIRRGKFVSAYLALHHMVWEDLLSLLGNPSLRDLLQNFGSWVIQYSEENENGERRLNPKAFDFPEDLHPLLLEQLNQEGATLHLDVLTEVLQNTPSDLLALTVEEFVLQCRKLFFSGNRSGFSPVWKESLPYSQYLKVLPPHAAAVLAMLPGARVNNRTLGGVLPPEDIPTLASLVAQQLVLPGSDDCKRFLDESTKFSTLIAEIARTLLASQTSVKRAGTLELATQQLAAARSRFLEWQGQVRAQETVTGEDEATEALEDVSGGKEDPGIERVQKEHEVLRYLKKHFSQIASGADSVREFLAQNLASLSRHGILIQPLTEADLDENVLKLFYDLQSLIVIRKELEEILERIQHPRKGHPHKEIKAFKRVLSLLTPEVQKDIPRASRVVRENPVLWALWMQELQNLQRKA